MTKESSEPPGSGDWQRRLDALQAHLLGLESEMQEIRQDLQQLRSEAHLRGVLDRADSPSPQPPPPSLLPTTPMSPVADVSPAVPQPPPAAPHPLVPVMSSEPAAPSPGEATSPPTAPAAAASPAVPPTVRAVLDVPAVIAPPLGKQGPLTPTEQAVLSAGPAKAPAAGVTREISHLEAKIGGAWLSWLGGLCVMVGAVWFFKYAIDQGWINPWLRVGTGWVLALVLLALGEWTVRRQMPWFAAGVTGAGIGLGYIVGYAASPLLYDLIPLTASYAVLSVVTAVGLLQAVRLNQLPTAILALLGGFLTLVLLRSPHPTAAGLLGYLLALGIGALGAGQIRRWPILRYLAWPGSAIFIAMYLSSNYHPGSELHACLSLLPALFALFQLDVFLWRIRAPEEQPFAASALSGLNCTGILLALWAAVSADQVAGIVGSAFFAVAAFQLVLARALWVLSRSEPNRHMSISLYGQASMAAALGFPVAFDRSLIVLGWSAQALTIAWLVRHVQSVLLRAKVPLLLAAGLVYVAYYFSDPYMLAGSTVMGMHLATRMGLAAAIMIGSGAAAWLFAQRYTQSSWLLERSLGEVCAALAAVGGAVAGATLLSTWPNAVHWVWVTATAGLCLGLLSYRAAVLRLPMLMTLTLIAAAALIIHDMGPSSSAVFQDQPWKVGPVGCGTLLPAGLILVALAFWNAWLFRHAATTRHLAADPGEWIAAIATAGTCLVLWHQLGDDNPAYAVLAATLAALLLIGAAWRWSAPAFHIWSAITWSIAGIYWILAATIGQRTDAMGHVSTAWIAVPAFANLTFISALGLILAAWVIAGRLKAIPGLQARGRQLLRSVPTLLAAYIVIHAASYEVDRWFQISAAAWFSRPDYIESVTLTCLWTMFALAYMAGGLRFSLRSLRIFGLLILAAAGLKLLAWDTLILRLVREPGHPWFWTTMVPLANPTFIAAVLLAVATWVERVAVRRENSGTAEGREQRLALLVVVPAYVLLHVFSFEVDRWFQIHGALHFASPEYVESVTLTATWAAFALAYLLASLRFALRPLWGLSLGIATVAAIKLIAADTLLRRFGEGSAALDTWAAMPAFLNPTLACTTLLAVVAFTSLATLRRAPWVDAEQRQMLESFLPTAAAYLLIHVLSFEVDRWFQAGGSARFSDPAHAERVALSVLWACCALSCVVSGLTFSIRPLRLFGLLVFAITAGKVLLRDMAHVAMIYRALSAMGLGVLSLAGSYAYQRVRRMSLQNTEQTPQPAEVESPARRTS